MLGLSRGHDLTFLDTVQATFKLLNPSLKLLVLGIHERVVALSLTQFLLLGESLSAELSIDLLLEHLVLLHQSVISVA